MCGRYTFQHVEALNRLIESLTGQTLEKLVARYNVAPSQDNPVVAAAEDRPNARRMRWGLVPFWDQSAKPKIAPINARSEEMMAKPTFKQAVQKRRCVVPADGFYEWQRPNERTKIPHLIGLKERKPFFIAGLYETETEVRPETYALLTCGPNSLMAEIHDRMPVILAGAALARWLQPGPITAEEVARICVPYEAGRMAAIQVSAVVNSARHDGPECVVPVLPSASCQERFGELNF